MGSIPIGGSKFYTMRLLFISFLLCVCTGLSAQKLVTKKIAKDTIVIKYVYVCNNNHKFTLAQKHVGNRCPMCRVEIKKYFIIEDQIIYK